MPCVGGYVDEKIGWVGMGVRVRVRVGDEVDILDMGFRNGLSGRGDGRRIAVLGCESVWGG